MTTRIVVRFRAGRAPSYSKNAEHTLAGDPAKEWHQLSSRFRGLSLEPHFTSISPQEIQKLETLKSFQGPSSLSHYFAVDCPDDVDAGAVLAALHQWPDVETAYIEPKPSDPVVNPGNDPRFPFQGYLRPAPQGIDAVFAWTQSGGDGTGQHFVDVEQGWTFNHEDLVAKGATLISGSISDASRAHGTSVLGEICAVDNALGGIGIVPNLASVSAASTTGSSVGNAILASISRLTNDLGALGVILIEQQWINWNGWTNMIVEVAPDVFDAIHLATQLGHLVVEAAGNGSHDLDTYQDGAHFVLRRGDAGFRDSGALVVGAGSWTAPHARLSFSNFGSRIDCYGWGEQVDTTTSNASGATDQYTSGFNGTSSASPIVTGAALSVQGMKAAMDRTLFNPGTLRAILSDPALGTPSANPALDRIGVMPNLQRIASAVLNLAPDLYIRDTISDVGQPHGAIASASPDIIIRRLQSANPQAEFGEGSGTESNATLSDGIIGGADYFGYIRVRNRSKAAATGAVATLYWASPATLITPKQWNKIGSTTINVPAGDVLTVTGPLPWPKTSIPGPGHYCFVATISHPYDLAPDLAALDPIQNFAAFIQVNNNVAWRNFNVADVRPQGVSESRELPFLVPNPEPGPFVDMLVQVWAALPPGSRLWLQMPDYVLPTSGLKVGPGTAPHTLRAELNPKGVTVPFAKQVLPNQNAMTLQVQIPRRYWDGGPFEVSARQFYRGAEVGRVTWLLQLPKGDRELSTAGAVPALADA